MSSVSMINGHIEEHKTNSAEIKTAVEFIEKELHKCEINLEKAKQRNAPEIDTKNIYKKINGYRKILNCIEELEITRQYIHYNNLEYDLLAYSKRRSE